jgi:hypothetical protein
MIIVSKLGRNKLKEAEKVESVQEAPECIGIEEIELSIEVVEECNGEAPVMVQSEKKPKRPYQWKGEKRRQRSEEHNAKIAKALSGRQLSEEHRQSIADAMIGNQNFR